VSLRSPGLRLLPEQQIQKYETGANRIGASRLAQICNVLEIPVSFLFEDAPAPWPGEGGMPQDMIDFMESEEGVRFVAAFERITDRKMRRGIARLANRVAEHAQAGASANILQFKEPADNT
jgi:transcriptional regulator with XRE-family HTH domain